VEPIAPATDKLGAPDSSAPRSARSSPDESRISTPSYITGGVAAAAWPSSTPRSALFSAESLIIAGVIDVFAEIRTHTPSG